MLACRSALETMLGSDRRFSKLEGAQGDGVQVGIWVEGGAEVHKPGVVGNEVNLVVCASAKGKITSQREPTEYFEHRRLTLWLQGARKVSTRQSCS